ncbi:Hypoxia up-regulated protein 1 [Dinochytrium kinnereticum]|nr:Hypoxia up-regulated protein 1 [Dinochytrium kinnereticum]
MRQRNYLTIALAGALALLLLNTPASASVIGIDYGSEWFKVSIVKPGVPLDIVLNRESKRKTSSLITVRDGIRFFGTDAVSLNTRYPKVSFPFLKSLLGVKYNSPEAVQYRNIFQNGMISVDERQTTAFLLSPTTNFTVEELVGMELAHAKQQAETFGGEAVSGAIITVPPFFTQVQRKAILDAAELASLRVLSLMNDNTATALNYAMTRNFKEPQYHIFFDSGAGNTFASLVKFQAIEVKDKFKKKTSVVEVEVKAVSSESNIGGLRIDLLVQKKLAEAFTELHGKKVKTPITDSPRAMMKLLKESNRVKQILSANMETIASVEGLHEDVDFKIKFSRAQLEELAADMFTRITAPISNVLKDAKLPIENITSVILVGGNVRIPAVQSLLKDIVGEGRIAVNINQDEAAVMGAGFRAAGVSNQFKVREIRVKDISNEAIDVWYEAQSSAGTKNARVLKTSLYSEGAAIGAKKLMNFKRITDFDFELRRGTGTPFVTASIQGLSAAHEKHKDTSVGEPKVKAAIELSESGIVSVNEAFVTYEIEHSPSLKDTVLSFFGGGKKKDEDLPEGENVASNQTAEDSKGTNSTAGAKNGTEPAGKKITTETVKLTINVTYTDIKPCTSEFKTAAIQRIAQMDVEDSLRRIREEARNTLEGFIYSVLDYAENEELQVFGVAEEWEKLKVVAAEAQDWLNENADDAETSALREKLRGLKAVHTPIKDRQDEDRKRPEAFAALKTALNATSHLISAYVNMTEDATSPILSELEPGQKLITEVEEWVKEKVEAQEKLLKNQDPAVRAKDIDVKRALVDKEFARLISKQSKFLRVSKKATTSSSSSSSSANATATESEKASPAESSEEAAGSAEPEASRNNSSDEGASSTPEPEIPEHSEL